MGAGRDLLVELSIWGRGAILEYCGVELNIDRDGSRGANLDKSLDPDVWGRGQ